jgi:hypothetical protein
MLTMNAQVLHMGWRGRAGLSALVMSRTARTRPFAADQPVVVPISRRTVKAAPAPASTAA